MPAAKGAGGGPHIYPLPAWAGVAMLVMTAHHGHRQPPASICGWWAAGRGKVVRGAADRAAPATVGLRRALNTITTSCLRRRQSGPVCAGCVTRCTDHLSHCCKLAVCRSQTEASFLELQL